MDDRCLGRRPRANQRGSMTLLSVGLTIALLVVSLVATGFTGLVAMQHRAAAAADLAALAAAGSPRRACAVATEVAADNGARLAGCEVAGVVVTVEVHIRARAPFGFRPTIRSRARAGPAELMQQSPGVGRSQGLLQPRVQGVSEGVVRSRRERTARSAVRLEAGCPGRPHAYRCAARPP